MERNVEWPMEGLTVVEFGHSVAGPFAGQILSDLGARVVKIEKPEGDDARRWGPPFLDGAAATFQALNKNKESVVVNLRNESDRSILMGYIVAHADVVVQNLRPGQMDALGLGADSLLPLKPGLVYCNMGAFGAKGPLCSKPGYDPLMQAFGGIMSVVGEDGRPSVRVGPSIIDAGTAMWAVIGILGALLRKKETGVGGVVDVSLFETAVGWMMMHAAQYAASGVLPTRAGSGQVGIVPYRAYETADGELVVAAGNNELFRRLCHVLGHPDWVSDPRFIDNPTRVIYADALYGLIEDVMKSRSNDEWITLFERGGVPCAPVQTVQQMLEHTQTRALDIVQDVPGSTAQLIGLPVSIDGLRPRPRSKAPSLGLHNENVFGVAMNIPE